MAKLKLRALRAREGDCLILEGGGARILIDGGPGGVFDRFLQPALTALADGDNAPVIDLVMVSHIDDDHIAGILDLTRTLGTQKEAGTRPLVRLKEAWHNSFSDMIAGAAPASNTTATHSASLAESAQMSDALRDLLKDQSEENGARLVLQSVRQGRELRLDLDRLKVPTNPDFPGGFVLGGAKRKTFRKLAIDVIGPGQTELDELRKDWKKALKTILKTGPASLAAAEKLDKSVRNLSSIVCIASVDGTEILLTGDARSDMILDWLKKAGRFDNGQQAHFAILKVPHHGSDYNVTTDFFRSVTADHYVISGDGRHGNPEPATLRMIFDARGNAAYSIHLTYSPADIMKHPKYKDNVSKLVQVLAAKPQNVTLSVPAPGSDEVSVLA